MIPSLLEAFDAILDHKNPQKMFITAISYKPFLSLFNITGVAAANPQLAGIGELFSYTLGLSLPLSAREHVHGLGRPML